MNILFTSLSKSVIRKTSRREIFGLGRIEHLGETEERIHLDGTRGRG